MHIHHAYVKYTWALFGAHVLRYANRRWGTPIPADVADRLEKKKQELASEKQKAAKEESLKEQLAQLQLKDNVLRVGLPGRPQQLFWINHCEEAPAAGAAPNV